MFYNGKLSSNPEIWEIGENLGNRDLCGAVTTAGLSPFAHPNPTSKSHVKIPCQKPTSKSHVKISRQNPTSNPTKVQRAFDVQKMTYLIFCVCFESLALVTRCIILLAEPSELQNAVSQNDHRCESVSQATSKSPKVGVKAV